MNPRAIAFVAILLGAFSILLHWPPDHVAAQPQTPTLIRDAQVSPPGTSLPCAIRVLTPLGWRILAPDASIVCDFATSTIRAVIPTAPASPVWVDEYTRAASNGETIVLGFTPAAGTALMVFRNGQKAREGSTNDYTFNAGPPPSLVFSTAAPIVAGDLVEVSYYRAGP